MAAGLRIVLLLLVSSLGLVQAGRAQGPDLAFFTEIDILIAEGRLAEAEASLEAEFLRPEPRLFEDRLSLLGLLADVQAQSEKPGDRGDTLTNMAVLFARAQGADHPDLAPVYAQAGDAYLAAGRTGRAIDSYRAALRLDEIYLDCASRALGESFGRIADALAEAGEAAASRRYRTLADDPVARCAGTADRSVSGRSITPAGPGGEGDFASVELFYGTDRRPSGAARPNDFYGWERGPLAYGRVVVAIPRDHKPGQVEAPSLLRFEWSENPALHIVLMDLEQLGEDAFFRRVAATLADPKSDEVLVFVHGFNTTFAEAARRTAQIAYDLNFEGVPMFYAWPSRGRSRAYLADSATVQVSARRLFGFLEQVVAQSGRAQINLIAHSMGSRALAEALELYAAHHPEARGVFAQVIFAAPDVDADLFALQAKASNRLAARVTLYRSSADVALTTSQALHGDAPRAGGGSAAIVSPDFDTVDMTAVGTDLLQHTYFAADSSALADILWLLWRNPSPDARCGMSETAVADGVYWVYRPEACNERLILPALTLARRLGAAALDHVGELMAAAGAGAGGPAADETSDLEALQEILTELLRD